MSLGARFTSAGLALLFLAGCGQGDDIHAKSKIVRTDYGHAFEFLSEGVSSSTASQLPAYELTIAVQKDATDDDLQKLKDVVFEEFAGPRATMLGFHRVVIATTDHTPPPLWITASIGPGPVPKEDSYDQTASGNWDRDGATPPILDYVSTTKLANGTEFSLAYSIEDFPKATYIYDCASCNGNPAAFFASYYDFLNKVAIPPADHEGLKSFELVVFLSGRKNLWDFPASVNLRFAKHSDGRWWGPIETPEKFVTNFELQLAKYKRLGEQMRRNMGIK